MRPHRGDERGQRGPGDRTGTQHQADGLLRSQLRAELEQRAVGEKFPAGIGYGRFNLSGTIEAYFEDFTFYDAFIGHDTISLGFSMEDVDHYKYYFTIPAIKITSDPIAPGGIDQDVMESMEWEAQRDPVLNTMFMIDRFSSVWPASDAA